MSKCVGKKFTMPTAVRVGIQMFNRIKSVHRTGYVHRDIKLNNFVCAPAEEDTGKKQRKTTTNTVLDEENGDDGMIYLIDFGIAKKVENEQIQ